MNWSDMNQSQRKQLVEESGYDADSLEAEDAYLIPMDEWDEYADSMLEECYDIPDYLASYIDWEKWRRDLEYDYIEVEIDNNSYMMRSF